MRNLLITVCFIFLFSHTIAYADENKKNSTWKITSFEWPPYASAHIKNGGTAINELRTLLSTQGITLEVEYLPWKEAQLKATLNEYVGYYPSWLSGVGSGFMPSGIITRSQLALLSAQDTRQDYTHQEQLFSGNRIGIVSSYTYPEAIERLIASYSDNIVRANSEQDLLTMLVNHSLDLVLSDPKIFSHYADKLKTPPPKTLIQFPNAPFVIAMRDQKDNQPRVKLLEQLLAQINDSKVEYIKPRKLLLTKINIPLAEPYSQFIAQVYGEMGISTEIRPILAKRGLILLDAGIIDADVARAAQNMSQYKNIILVKPSLGNIDIVLLCQKQLSCNRDILSDGTINITSSLGNIELLTEFNIKANITTNENIDNSLLMLKKGRLDYLLYPSRPSERARLLKDFHLIELRQIAINTVINKKHAPLVPELSKAIKNRLPALQQRLDAAANR